MSTTSLVTGDIHVSRLTTHDPDFQPAIDFTKAGTSMILSPEELNHLDTEGKIAYYKQVSQFHRDLASTAIRHLTSLPLVDC